MEQELIVQLLEDQRAHFTYSQKNILLQTIPQICLKNSISLKEFLKELSLAQILESELDSVQKGKKIFKWVLKMRYPLSNGTMETFPPFDLKNKEDHLTSQNVLQLDSRKKLINRYFYGKGIFDLKEYVISLIRSCPLDCAYCFLREVYDDPRFKVLPDIEKIKAELRLIRDQENGVVYLNAGENADSLIFDLEFGLIEKLWNTIQDFPNVFVEFRSKTNKIENLFKIKDHQKRMIMAFSLNPEEDRAIFESNTATILERILAMKQLAENGFALGLRFEPILYTKNYKEKYKKLFADLFSQISPSQVHSISLGCLRLTKGLAKILGDSHPSVMVEEWILAEDQKVRYFRGIRVELYQNLLELLKEYFGDDKKIVLSTEPVLVWKESGVTLKTMPEIC